MPEPTDRLIVAATVAAVQGVVRRLQALWEDEYRDLVHRQSPAIWDVGEPVLTFEVACQLQQRVRPEFEVTWEHQYGQDDHALADVVVDHAGQKFCGPDRTVIEVKWMSRGANGLDRLASDALKIGWCPAKHRYVLGVGLRDKDLDVDLKLVAAERVQWGDRLQLRQALTNLRSCRLAMHEAVDDVTVALYRVEHLNPLH